MPYKDPEERHRYDHAFKPRLRGQKGVTNSGQTPVRKAYICFRFPELKLSHIPFRNGWFVTDSPDEQATIEQELLYGSEIFSWQLSLSYPGLGFDNGTVNPVKPKLAEKFDAKFSDRALLRFYFRRLRL